MLFVPPFSLDSAEEVCGIWSRDQLVEMNDRFVAAVLTAFELGLESRAVAAATVRIGRNGSRRLAEEAAIGAAWRWFAAANFDVPAAVILARCPGVAPERVREGIKCISQNLI